MIYENNNLVVIIREQRQIRIGFFILWFIKHQNTWKFYAFFTFWMPIYQNFFRNFNFYYAKIKVKIQSKILRAEKIFLFRLIQHVNDFCSKFCKLSETNECLTAQPQRLYFERSKITFFPRFFFLLKNLTFPTVIKNLLK